MSVFELSGRKALGTGGAQGLGEGMARALADAGAQVMIADLQDGSAVAKSLGEGHAATTLDVSSDEAWEAAIARTVDGHHTGDIGYLDDDNFLFIVDRAKDMIITGGFNVYSTEVEQALMAHPDIRDCAVIGQPDEKWGERVVAVVQPHPGREIDPDEVRSFVKERIGAVKAPKMVLAWPDLPRSKVGKVLKTEIKASLASE